MTGTQVELRWEGGGEACIVSTDGERAELRSTRPAAPGTPMRAAVSFDSAASLLFKVQGCRREEGGSFSMRGRWVNLTKVTRQELLARTGASC